MKLSGNILGSWTQLALLTHDWLPFMKLYGPRTFEFENCEDPPCPRYFSREAHVQTRDYVALNCRLLGLTDDSGRGGIVEGATDRSNYIMSCCINHLRFVVHFKGGIELDRVVYSGLLFLMTVIVYETIRIWQWRKKTDSRI